MIAIFFSRPLVLMINSFAMLNRLSPGTRAIRAMMRLPARKANSRLCIRHLLRCRGHVRMKSVGWLTSAAVKPGGEVARSTRGQGVKSIRAVIDVAGIAEERVSCNSKSEADNPAGVVL